MNNLWKHVVVLGAAGKMGRGIALLLLQEIAQNKEGGLTLLDFDNSGFELLKQYLRQHLLKYAERNINQLRILYCERDDLIDNGDMIREFVDNGLDRVRLVVSVEDCREATMVFEAVVEDIAVKSQVLDRVRQVAASEAYYFSNTSSIPIHLLQEKSHLLRPLIGMHFYNPPVVQKLLEIIIPDKTMESAKSVAVEIGKQLQKTVVFSRDIAGFIGNGHFIREMVEACHVVENMRQKMPLPDALSNVNAITQYFLLRPMGIFQLIDYVGIDVCQKISHVMTDYLPGQNFITPLIENMTNAGIKGGQYGDGSQKDGFFMYEKGQPVKVYDYNKREYVKSGLKLAQTPSINWKALQNDKNSAEKVAAYLNSLHADQTPDGRLAMHFLKTSYSIAQGLVSDGVASSIQDVDTVLKNGFFHLYGVEAFLYQT